MSTARVMYPADLAEHMTPGKPYRPSNGSEGDAFYSRWCEDCQRDAEFRATQTNGCPIWANALAYNASDPKYPQELTHDANGQPCCTAHTPEGER
jgi:hypothetical protein